MNRLLNTTVGLTPRVLPATAVAAVAALSLGAYTGHATQIAGRRHKPTFTVTVAPAQDTIAAGSMAGYRLRLRRRHFPWAISLKVLRPLPAGATARFSTGRRTLASRSTLTIRTRAWTPPGVYRLTLRAKHGRIVRRITLTLTVAGSTPGAGTAPVAIPRFSIAGDAAAPLEPGAPEGIDLQITNPNTVPVVVGDVTATLRSVSAPNATPALPCTLGDFALAPYAGPLPLTIPAVSTRTLAQLGISPADWPQIAIIDRPANQDGCEGATVTMSYSGSATLG